MENGKNKELPPAPPQLDAEGNPVIQQNDGQDPSGSRVAPATGTQVNTGAADEQTKKAPADDQTKKGTNKPNPNADLRSPSALIDEILDGDDKKKKGPPRKRTQSAKNPTIQSQLAELMSKLDQQAARTDELYTLVRPAPQTTPRRRHDQPYTVRRHTPIMNSRRPTRPVVGSHYKRRSPKEGRRIYSRTSRDTSYRPRHSPAESSFSSASDVEAQVGQALDMMEPRFATHKGKPRYSDDSIQSYRPFAFLEREKQRENIRHGHPKELTFVQHVTGLCTMALEYIDDRCKTYWVLQHVIQILEDHEYIQWQQTRAFSNTVISNIARGRWAWDDEKLIERCRSNNYMRRRTQEESAWIVPCPRFNKGRCDEQDSHYVGQVHMRHMCTHCAMNGYENPHTLRACSHRKGTASASSQYKGNEEEKRDYRGSKSHSTHRHDASDMTKN